MKKLLFVLFFLEVISVAASASASSATQSSSPVNVTVIAAVVLSAVLVVIIFVGVSYVFWKNKNLSKAALLRQAQDDAKYVSEPNDSYVKSRESLLADIINSASIFAQMPPTEQSLLDKFLTTELGKKYLQDTKTILRSGVRNNNFDQVLDGILKEASTANPNASNEIQKASQKLILQVNQKAAQELAEQEPQDVFKYNWAGQAFRERAERIEVPPLLPPDQTKDQNVTEETKGLFNSFYSLKEFVQIDFRRGEVTIYRSGDSPIEFNINGAKLFKFRDTDLRSRGILYFIQDDGSIGWVIVEGEIYADLWLNLTDWGIENNSPIVVDTSYQDFLKDTLHVNVSDINASKRNFFSATVNEVNDTKELHTQLRLPVATSTVVASPPEGGGNISIGDDNDDGDGDDSEGFVVGGF